MLEQLPFELLTKVLEFSTLPERLHVARGNHELLQRVTVECSSLWVKIDFSPFQEQCKKQSLGRGESLLDSMLRGLLVRVNARETTTYLSLQGCTEIVGHGLEPMRGSHVLERINLDVGPFHQALDEQVILDILRTMLPHKLYHVEFPLLNGTWPHIPRVDFIRDLHAAMKQRDLDQKVACTSCHYPVCDETKQIVPSFHGLPPSRCGVCHKPYCRTATCPTGMKDCRECGKASCAPCNEVLQCSNCAISYCSDCEFVTDPCIVCKKRSCSVCVSIPICTVAGCTVALCDGCAEQSSISLERCDICEDTICSKCYTMSRCDRCDFQSCHETFCSECDSGAHCSECERHFCSSCFGGDDGVCRRCVYDVEKRPAKRQK